MYHVQRRCVSAEGVLDLLTSVQTPDVEDEALRVVTISIPAFQPAYKMGGVALRYPNLVH